MSMNRSNHLAAMIEDNPCLWNPKELLESIVRQMSDQEYWDAIDYLEENEGWNYKCHRDTGNLISSDDEDEDEEDDEDDEDESEEE